MRRQKTVDRRNDQTGKNTSFRVSEVQFRRRTRRASNVVNVDSRPQKSKFGWRVKKKRISYAARVSITRRRLLYDKKKDTRQFSVAFFFTSSQFIIYVICKHNVPERRFILTTVIDCNETWVCDSREHVIRAHTTPFLLLLLLPIFRSVFRTTALVIDVEPGGNWNPNAGCIFTQCQRKRNAPIMVSPVRLSEY